MEDRERNVMQWVKDLWKFVQFYRKLNKKERKEKKIKQAQTMTVVKKYYKISKNKQFCK